MDAITPLTTQLLFGRCDRLLPADTFNGLSACMTSFLHGVKRAYSSAATQQFSIIRTTHKGSASPRCDALCSRFQLLQYY